MFNFGPWPQLAAPARNAPPTQQRQPIEVLHGCNMLLVALEEMKSVHAVAGDLTALDDASNELNLLKLALEPLDRLIETRRAADAAYLE